MRAFSACLESRRVCWQTIGERAASRAGADNDDVVSVGGHDLLPGCTVSALLCTGARHVYCVLLEPAANENAAPMRDVIQLGAHDARSTCQQSVCVGGGEHSDQGRDQVDPEPLIGMLAAADAYRLLTGR